MLGEKREDYYLGASEEAGALHGALREQAPTVASAKDNYIAAYDVTATNIDEKGLTYTTAPFSTDAEITGHPLLHLWVSSSVTDADLFVYLEDVDASGNTTVISNDRLRASLRSVNNPPFDNGGVPWHRAYAQDVQKLIPGAPVEMVFGLLPVSRVFLAGHCTRLTITCAAPGAEFLKPSPAYQVSIWRDAAHKSSLTLPFHVRPYAFQGTAKLQTAGFEYNGPAALYLGSQAAYLNLGGEVDEVEQNGEA